MRASEFLAGVFSWVSSSSNPGRSRSNGRRWSPWSDCSDWTSRPRPSRHRNCDWNPTADRWAARPWPATVPRSPNQGSQPETTTTCWCTCCRTQTWHAPHWPTKVWSKPVACCDVDCHGLWPRRWSFDTEPISVKDYFFALYRLNVLFVKNSIKKLSTYRESIYHNIRHN